MKYRMYSPQAIFETGRCGNQEDSLYPAYGTASADDRLFIVCDGGGSRTNGNIASSIISKDVASYLRRNTSYDRNFSDSMLADALDHAFQELKKKGKGAEGLATTFAFLYLHHGGATAAYIGDTRILHIRPSLVTETNGNASKGLLFASRNAGSGAAPDAEGGAGQTGGTPRLIGVGGTEKPRPAIHQFSDVRQGDYFVICTKGMLETLTDEDLAQLLSEKGGDEKKRKQLVASTIDNNQNHSAYILHVENVMTEAGDDDYSSSAVGTTISYGRYGSSRRKRNYGAVLKYLLVAAIAAAVIYLCYDYFANRPAKQEPKTETAVPDSTANTPQQPTTAAEGQQDTVAKPAATIPQASKPVKTAARAQEEQSASGWLYDNSGSATTTPKPAEQTETKPEAPTQKPAATPEPVKPAAPAATQPAATSEGGTD